MFTTTLRTGQLALRLYRRSNKKGSKLSINARRLRFFASSCVCVEETITLPVGHNGSISLRVTRPTASASATQGESRHGSNVVLYLPPGPLFQEHDHSAPSHTTPSHVNGIYDEPESSIARTGHVPASHPPQHILASTTSATVVTVNYRLGTTSELPSNSASSQILTSSEFQLDSACSKHPEIYKYPTPIHDTLTGFDWIQNNLNPAKVAVFGSHIGGSLAIMLALTEAQTLHAVSAMDPICDWPGLDEYCAIEDESVPDAEQDITAIDNPEQKPKPPKRKPKKRSSRTTSPKDLLPLLTARERFFTSPERYFDAFASPILFLRSAGRDVPKTFPQYMTGPEFPVPTMKIPRKTTSAEQYSASEGSLWDRDIYPDLDAEDTTDDVLESSTPTVHRRKALSRWPPYGLDYGLNNSNIWSGPDHGIARLQVVLPWVRVWVSRGRGRDMSTGLVDVEHSSSGVRNKESHDENTVLARQGEEMVSVMRRACFWGREKGVGERRVTLSRVGLDLHEEVGEWLKRTFEGSMDED